MTPKRAGQQLLAAASRAEARARRELSRAQDRVVAFGVQQTSGGHSTESLGRIARQRGAGVYSIRRPDNSFPPDKANRQTGDLASHWQKGAIYTDSLGDLHGPVVNNSKDARWFDGQPHGNTRARDVALAVEKAAEQGFFSRIASAIRNALK